MRSVKAGGKITRNGFEGTPWSDVWGEVVGRCRGFGLPGEVIGSLEIEDEVKVDEETVDEPTTEKRKEEEKPWEGKYKLKCYPSTVVYGHAATRGLDVKRWSFGIDTGCLYGRKLTALVVSRATSEVDDEEEDAKGRKMTFGDEGAGLVGRLVSVGCPDLDENDE